MLPRWNFTVCSEQISSRAIWAVVMPRAAAARIARSRPVSSAPGACSGATPAVGPSGRLGAWKTAPLATWRNTEATSEGLARLTTKALAPAFRAISIEGRSSLPESTTILTSGCWSRNRAMCSAPATPGIRKSTSTTSGARRSTSASSSWIVCASPTTSIPSPRSSARRTPATMSGWSSAISTRRGSAPATVSCIRWSSSAFRADQLRAALVRISKAWRASVKGPTERSVPDPAQAVEETRPDPPASSPSAAGINDPGTDAEAAIEGDRQHPPGGYRRGRRRILVVDDQPVNRMLLERLLADIGHDSAHAGDGAEALALLARERFDLVLMDCQMPVLDGYEATRRLRQREDAGKRIPVVAMTASALRGQRERCLAAGMDDYLRKPVTLAALNEILARWTPQEQLDSEALASSPLASFPADLPAAPSTGADLPAAHSTGADLPPPDIPSLDTRALGPAALDTAAPCDARRLAELRGLFPGGQLAEILEQLQEDVECQLVRVARALACGDGSGAAEAAHRILSSARLVGAAALSDAATELEQLARANDLTAAAAARSRVRQHWAVTITALATERRRCCPQATPRRLG